MFANVIQESLAEWELQSYSSGYIRLCEFGDLRRCAHVMSRHHNMKLQVREDLEFPSPATAPGPHRLR